MRFANRCAASPRCIRIIFDDEALDDLAGIRAWFAKNNPRAADDFIKKIFDKVENLLAPKLSYMGRRGLDPGTHELIEYPYIIVYEVHEDRGDIVVLSVVHGAQDRKLAGNDG
ncbi:MAG: type II toxin-antitoxin system RelE/ParE family toxin [Pseudolabrys sp.]